MPKRTDIHKILLIGSGPIVIGQGCEFDYSGSQACKALREEGYEIVLINSNPATIMTDPEMADRTYVEPILPDVVERIIERERPDALLPTMGGQTALNVAVALVERGVLEKYQVKLIGAQYEAIKKAEDRERFKQAVRRIGLQVPESGTVSSFEAALSIIDRVGFPAIIRPSFTLGGTGGSVAYNREEFKGAVEWGLEASPTHEILIEQSVLGWKEFELEVMRDTRDNVVIVCSIENVDPMGVHTGDSITVAPAMTLTDKEYQVMRDASLAIIREIGVETGGSNIQFAVNPENGQMVVIEMNPRVSRSSALASKATGFPIAKIAAKLAVGYTLDELANDITRETRAAFEPTIDYVVVKIPRFTFEKFPQADATLTTQMKSVGEVMAIGRTFKEALQKAIRSLEIDRHGLESALRRSGGREPADGELERVREKLRIPNWERLWYVADALRLGMTVEEIARITRIDPWFLRQIAELVAVEDGLLAKRAALVADGIRPDPENMLPRAVLVDAKTLGFSDHTLGRLIGAGEDAVRAARERLGIRPVYKRVDTCGAEFVAHTPYLYSTYESVCEAEPTTRKKVMILGGGPNRIGQGIEFDYCCVHASYALREEGYETIMVNCNPETVSTDYDTSDRLYFEPLTLEDVLHIIAVERPLGVVVQFGGQTPLKLAVPLERAGVPILGTSPDAIDRAEDRERFRDLLIGLGLKQPHSGMARSTREAIEIAGRIGYPVMVRPSYVLGGRAMAVIYDEPNLETYMSEMVSPTTSSPVLVDQYIEDAIEIDVDALSDGSAVAIGGIMEHIEQAGIHSGDSACSLPAYSLPAATLAEIERQTVELARALQVVGLMNIQFAVKGNDVYVLEVNPRASRTVPFVSKTIGVPLAKWAMKVMMGKKLSELGEIPRSFPYTAVKEAVFPFNRFPGVDTVLGPEMKSTGEVMGIDRDFGRAFAKAQAAAGGALPDSGRIFLSVRDADQEALAPLAEALARLGFSLIATSGTAGVLRRYGINVEVVLKVHEDRPHIVDHLKNREVHLVINTVGDQTSQKDSAVIRRTTLLANIPYVTTLAGARAAVAAMQAARGGMDIRTLQEYYRERRL
ncbi:MAG: carbamoyl-phosphate synthase large subunit [Nitrospirae bacterium]|nr:carbamoyl-phosphate synthase large subunit [Nitrospirota bacterium]